MTDYDRSQDVVYNNNELGFGHVPSLPTMADYAGLGQADFSDYQPLQPGDAYLYLDVGAGRIAGCPFANPADLSANAPAWMLTEKVRGLSIYPTYISIDACTTSGDLSHLKSVSTLAMLHLNVFEARRPAAV